MRRYTQLLLIMILFLLGGCGANSEKTTVGFINTLSGRYSDIGQDSLKGVLLALSDSGMQDRVKLEIADDMGTPSNSTSILNSLFDKGVKYILGPGLSSVGETAAPLLKSRGLYMLSPTVSTSMLAEKNDSFARTIPHNSRKQADAITGYIVNKLDIKDIIIIYDNRNSAYSTDIVKNTTASFMSKGASVRDIRSFNPESGQSMQELISQDKPNPPGMYYIIGAPLDTALIIWQIRKAGYNSKITVRAWAVGKEFFRFGGDAVEGVYLFDHYMNKTSRSYVDFRVRYNARFQEDPSWMSVHGYEAGILLFSSLKSLQSGTPFVAALRANSNHLKLLSDLKMDEFGDAYLPLNAFIINNGRIELLGTAE